MRTGALIGFWCIVIDTIRLHGWVSKRTAETSHDATVKPTVFRAVQRLVAHDPIADDAQEAVTTEAARVYDWARGQTGPDAYRAKIGQLARGERDFTDAELAFAASIPEAYTRDLAASNASNAPNRSRYVGTVGARDTFALTVERVIDLEGSYGTSGLHVMRDSQGNRYTWNCTSYSNRLEVGKTYSVKATVKGHRDYKGEAETRLTRARKVAP